MATIKKPGNIDKGNGKSSDKKDKTPRTPRPISSSSSKRDVRYRMSEDPSSAVIRHFKKTSQFIPSFPNIPQINNTIAFIEYIRHNNVNFNHFNYLRQIVTLPDQTISDWLHISAKTFLSYRTQGKTSPKENTQEQALMIIALYKHAEEVFDSNEDFTKWLNTPNFFFDNKAPQELLGTISGIKYIDDRLTAMEYGDNV